MRGAELIVNKTFESASGLPPFGFAHDARVCLIEHVSNRFRDQIVFRVKMGIIPGAWWRVERIK